MTETTYFCDGTGKKLSDEDLAASQVGARKFVEAHPELVSIVQEIFCPACADLAPEYWMEKADLLREAAAQLSNRLQRHRRSFFQEKLKHANSKARPGSGGAESL